jgi:gamma-glutamylcyclotransferase (GGCT)/AIG2-like uncharacterized protein YtfP
MTTNIFTYGSLMFAPVWQQIVKGQYLALPTVLAEHQRLAVLNEEYPAAIYQPTHSIHGILYLGVNTEDVARLDQFEGEYYDRVSVQVTDAHGVAYPADVYRLNAQFQAILAPVDWNIEQFKQQGLQRFLQQYKGFLSL